jgi:SAM-dependent methyltransferase
MAHLDPLRYDGQEPDPFESTGMILDMIPLGSRVLDVGCGTGSISSLIRDIRRCTVIGIEPHAERARKARSPGKLSVHDDV